MSKGQLPAGYHFGRFISESKNRFRCLVEINDVETPCYIASSCRLDNFIALPGKIVLIKPTIQKNASIPYSLFAVKYKKSYIILNTSYANRAIENSIQSRKLSCLGNRNNLQREHTVEGYKSDFYFPNSRTVVEVKSIITTDNTAQFCTVYSERFCRQLVEIERLLKSGYNVHLLIVSLNPYVQSVELPRLNELAGLIAQCQNYGLQITAFTCRMQLDGEVYIHRQIPVKIGSN